MGTLMQDLRFSLRMLRKNSGFTLVALSALALGIGANTAIFSLVNAVLLRPLNYREPERLVKVWEGEPGEGIGLDNPAVGNYADWRAQNQSFAGMAAVELRSYNLTGDGEPERINVFGVTANFFPLLGASPAQGRTFSADDDRPGAGRVAVISHSLAGPLRRRALGRRARHTAQRREVLGRRRDAA